MLVENDALYHLDLAKLLKALVLMLCIVWS